LQFCLTQDAGVSRMNTPLVPAARSTPVGARRPAAREATPHLRLFPTADAYRAEHERTLERGLARALDVVVAGALVIIFSLPMLVIGLLIRLTSRGPALYRQQRIGLGGKPFVLLKFRTMRADAEARTGPVWAKRGDPRRTLVGRVLRRLSIDELPQLINVLRGEMSLVGPRPERPYFVTAFTKQLPDYPQRHHVLPGITGWAQVNGWRGNTAVDKRLEYDLYFIRNWTLAFHVRILLITPFRILLAKNAY